MRPARELWNVLVVGWSLCGPPAVAERYLTIPEAQRLCFPLAERFEPLPLQFTPEQVKTIEKQSGSKLSKAANRVWSARRGTNLLGVMFLDHVLGKHDVIDYAVAINPAGKVLQVEILEYRETYGDEIRGETWRRQFAGKSAASKLKLHDDIYNISGATISCRHVTEGIKRVLVTYDTVVRPRLAAAGELPNPAPP